MYPGFDNPDYIIERIEAGAVYGAFFGDNTANDTINTLAGIIGIHEEGQHRHALCKAPVQASKACHST